MESFEDLNSSRIGRAHVGLLVLASMGMFLDGYDLSVITLGILVIPRQLDFSKLQYLLVNVSSFAGMLIGAPLLGALADRYGRKTVFGVDLVLFVVFAVTAGLARSFGLLFASRLLLCVGIGGDYPISSTMVSEFAPVRSRGRLLFAMVGMYWVGTLFAGLINYLFAGHTDFWRYSFVIGGLLAIPVIALRFRTPESPRWLVSRGRIEEADRSRERITGLKRPPRPQEAREAGSQEAGRALRLGEVFRGRYALVTLFVLAAWFIFDVESYGFGFYIPLMFSELGFAGNYRHIAVGGMVVALGAILGYLIAILIAERVGRRYLTIIGFGMMFALLLLASLTQLRGVYKVVPFVFVFLLFEQWIGAVTLFYPTELFPTSVRSSVQGLATAVSRLGAILGVVVFPLVPIFHSLLVFALMALAGLVVAVVLAPETKQSSLEEIVRRYSKEG
jgi:MFS family permease